MVVLLVQRVMQRCPTAEVKISAKERTVPALGLGANLPARVVSGVDALGGGEGVVMSVLRLQGHVVVRLLKGLGVCRLKVLL